MAFMLMERNSGKSTIDYPIEGSRGIVDALMRGIQKNGGRILLRARVEDVLMEGEDGAQASHGLADEAVIVTEKQHASSEFYKHGHDCIAAMGPEMRSCCPKELRKQHAFGGARAS